VTHLTGAWLTVRLKGRLQASLQSFGRCARPRQPDQLVQPYSVIPIIALDLIADRRGRVPELSGDSSEIGTILTLAYRQYLGIRQQNILICRECT
jgi:hypothetical protein